MHWEAAQQGKYDLRRHSWKEENSLCLHFFWLFKCCSDLSSRRVAALLCFALVWKWEERLTHFTESFYWECDSGYGYPQAFLLWLGTLGDVLFYHANRYFSRLSARLWMTGAETTLSHLQELGQPDLLCLYPLASLGKKPQASDLGVGFRLRDILYLNHLYTSIL